MKINLNLLPVKINEEFVIPEDFYKNTSIKKLDKVKVDGIIKYNAADEIAIFLDVKGNMFLTDAITNEQVKYPFSIQIDEILEENDENYAKYFEKNQNILDIIEFLWENIVLEVPLRVVKEDANFISEGNGWSLVEENDKEEVNSPLSDLQKLLDMEGKR